MCSDSNCYVPFFNIYWSVYGILGLFLQLTLIYLIFQKLPVFLNNLRYFLINSAFSQLTLVILAFTSQYRFLTNSTSMAILSPGPCRFFGPDVCFANYIIYMVRRKSFPGKISVIGSCTRFRYGNIGDYGVSFYSFDK